MASMLDVDLTMLAESATNPRKRFNQAQLEDLAQNIKAHGVLEPLLARPMNPATWKEGGLQGVIDAKEQLEVIAGARRYRASGMAGLTKVPVIVRLLSDVEVEFIQLAENVQRSDLTPLEEADALSRLVTIHRVSIPDVAAQVGRSRDYVVQRLRLAALPEAARTAIDEGFLPVSVGLALCSLAASVLPDAIQSALTLADNNWSATAIIGDLKQRWTLHLGAAPFPLDDAGLGAGECISCPKRSSAQLSLIAEGAKLDTCLDRDCYKSKADAWWERRRAAAKADGLKVADTKEVFPHGYMGATHVRLDHTCHEDPKHRTYRELLAETDAPKILVRAPNGEAVEVIKAPDARKALATAGHKFAQHTKREKTPVEKRYEEQAKVDAETEVRMLTAVQVEMSKEKPAQYSLPFWRLLAKVICAGRYYEVQNRLVHRRNLLPSEPDPAPAKGKKSAKPVRSATVDNQELLNKAIDGYQISECRSIIVEALVYRDVEFTADHDDDTVLDHFAKLWGVSRMVIEKRVRAELTKAPTKPSPKASAKPTRKGGAK